MKFIMLLLKLMLSVFLVVNLLFLLLMIEGKVTGGYVDFLQKALPYFFVALIVAMLAKEKIDH